MAHCKSGRKSGSLHQNPHYLISTAQLIEEHLTENSIIFSEQAGAKKGSWGCIDKLMINKVVTDEVVKGHRNLSMMWLDYKKAYDSVPHAWILESLRSAKIPENIIQAIEQLISSWKTELNIPTVDGNITIGDVIYEKGVLQGDYRSVILFILSKNPLSYLLNTRTKGIKMGLGSAWQRMLSPLFFADDLKLFSSGIAESKLQLAIVIEFSRDIGMSFGEDKCGYICIEHGKRKSQEKSIVINGVNIKELEEGESYRYLGKDEAIGYEGKLNKERVTKEYYRRVKCIWSSELNAKNRSIAHNCFALPVLIPTISILEWKLSEIEGVDIRTRKILGMTGNFHRNSDKHRLYAKRAEGGRGLKSFEESYIMRIVSLKRHIVKNQKNKISGECVSSRKRWGG